MKTDSDTLYEIQDELKCSGCAAILKFAPGTKSLQCIYCEKVTEITAIEEVIEEMDLEEYLSNQTQQEEKNQVTTVKCNGCNAEVGLKPNVTSDVCPFCGVSLIVKNGTTHSVLKPKSILPFKLKQPEAQDAFKKWIKGLWFAPNRLKKYAKNSQRLNGMYIPYWTYDAATRSSYSGQRGDNYQVSETYTANENGRSVTRTRSVTKIRWQTVSGNVSRTFDDVLVAASLSLPEEFSRALGPWDLSGLTPFDEKFLSGFRTESYQITVAHAWPKAKEIMAETITQDAKRNIGGDHQRISSLSTNYQNTTFKHTLLPIWISSYQYNKKSYRFLVNGQTGKIQGDRPYSWIKISLLVLFILSLILIISQTGSNG